jgi:hypothetical protein
MEHSPSWEAKGSSTNQETPHTLWNPKVHYILKNSTQLVPILIQINITFCNSVPFRFTLVLSPIYVQVFQVVSSLQVSAPKHWMCFPSYSIEKESPRHDILYCLIWNSDLSRAGNTSFLSRHASIKHCDETVLIFSFYIEYNLNSSHFFSFHSTFCLPIHLLLLSLSVIRKYFIYIHFIVLRVLLLFHDCCSSNAVLLYFGVRISR